MYWYIWVSLKSKFVFFTTTSSKTGHKSDNFSDIKKPERILLDNLIKKVCKIWVDWMKIISLMLPADLKNMDLRKKTVVATILKKKITKQIFYTL